MNNADILIPLTIFIGSFAVIFGWRYLTNKERMALIERGLNPIPEKPESKSNYYLKLALLLMGAGLGLFLAFVLDRTVFVNNVNEWGNTENEAVYFSLITLFGGLGLFISYMIDKEEKQQKL
ncbi:hypothetical protein FYC62_13865 [Pedobacter aquae]|uniref:DUF6249 domain-containing protein n=1 Tax=Pedobacter aquae TaxID=2605747 RepID=A0A5C0VKG1_9SPHI|nr:DUF6249 domain-containing protein [Pedobacter aquae]QEK52619.1 hypothetical protein FYC62_13865 [Pedobacter aquae]